ncbi:phospholipase A2 group V isoform X1 [Chlorocebus sabaeus]|uniref:phospholipase A2 group V isoform X1 n=2 Tax=Chlorocebus sabaeus TaxID=60711 RepID=UPI003BF96BBF
MPGGAGGLVQGEPWARCEILDRAPFPSMPQFPVCVPAVQGGLLDLKSMIEKVTGKNALTNYGFYGCYCGWGGQGTPKDGTDRVSLVTQAGVQWCDLSSLHPRPSVLRCCWVHDHCYGRLEEKGCNIRIQSYKYRFAWGLVTCEPGPFCHVQLCACDRKLVYCLKRNLWSYNPQYQYFPNILCS